MKKDQKFGFNFNKNIDDVSLSEKSHLSFDELEVLTTGMQQGIVGGSSNTYQPGSSNCCDDTCVCHPAPPLFEPTKP